MTKGIQNHVRFLKSRKTCAHVRRAKTTAAIAPPAMEGVYGQSTYAGFVVSAMVNSRGIGGSKLGRVSFGSASMYMTWSFCRILGVGTM